LALIKVRLLAHGSSDHQALTVHVGAAAIVTRELEVEPMCCPQFTFDDRDIVDHDLKRSLVVANPRLAATREPQVMGDLCLEETPIRNLPTGFVARRALQPHPQAVLDGEEPCAIALTRILARNLAAASIRRDALG